MLYKHSLESSVEAKNISEVSNKELLELCYVMSKHVVEGNVQFNSSDDLTLNEVLDGIDCVFGINEDEKVFLDVEEYDEREEAEAILKSNPNILQAMQEIYDNYGPVQVECTMFPNFSHQGDDKGNVTYSVLPYDRRKFGQQGAFVIGEIKSYSPKHKNYVKAVDSVRRSVYNRLQEADNSKWRVYNDSHTRMDVSMPFVLEGLQDILLDEDKYAKAMSVLDNPDGDSHRNVLERMLNGVKKQLEKSVNHHISRSNSVFGRVDEKSRIRSSVMNVKTPSGLYKFNIDNKAFERLKRRKYMTRENIKELESLSELNFFNEVFGFDAKDGDEFQKAVGKVANNFRSNKVGEERVNHFLNNVINELKKEGHELIESEVRAKAINQVLAARSDLEEIKQQIAEEEEDPDTMRKINAVVEKLEKKLSFIEKHIGVKGYQGQAYVLYLLKLVLAPKMKNLVDRITERFNEDGHVVSNAVPAEKVLLYVSEAQPWTATEDKMIFEAKQRLTEFNASKVLILVNGEGYEERVPTATNENETYDLQKNSPLSLSRRIDLVSSVYEDDIQVEVDKRGFKEDGPTKILEQVFLRDNKEVVGVICPKNESKTVGSKWNSFDKQQWRENICYELPIPFNEGVSGLGIVGVSDVGISQEKARKIVKEAGLDMWLEMVAPVGISESALSKYKECYEAIYKHYMNIDEEEYRSKMKSMFRGGE